jgi:hypothetical protein
MGSVHGYGEEQPCVVMAQGDPERLVSLVLATMKNGSVGRLDMCMVPSLQEARRSGDYPGR